MSAPAQTGSPAPRAARRAFLPLRLARREMRGGFASLRIFLACLALGVFALSAVASLEAALIEGLAAQGKEILGGDVELRLVHRPLTPELRARLAARAQAVSETRQMRSMAHNLAAASSTLVEVKAVDHVYPLAGSVALAPGQPLAAALAPAAGGAFGAAVEASLLESLGLKLGGRFRIGAVELVARARLEGEPDRLAEGVFFAPRVLVRNEALAASGLIRPGSLINYHYRFLLAGADIDSWVARLKRDFPQAGWRIRDRSDSSPSVRRFVERIALLLTLTSLSALLVGGIGIANAVTSWLEGRIATIAIFKCLGAGGGDIFRIYLVQILALALAGIGLGLALGAVVPFLAASFFAGILPVPLAAAVYWPALAACAAYGLLIALLFSLWPLARARAALPQSLLRARIAPLRGAPGAVWLIASAALAALLAGLALLLAPDQRFALRFILYAPLAFAFIYALASLFLAGLNRAARPRRPVLALARANILRNRADSAAVIMALALGLGLISAVAIVDANLQNQIRGQLPERAPAFFFADIRSGQIAAFTDFLKRQPGVERIETTPMLRGRITRIKERDAAQARPAPESAWVLQGDRGLTYSRTPPANARIVAGRWWPPDYRGPPLLSIGAQIAEGLGLKPGDTLTVNVLGRPVTATIANLREIDWSSLGINFVLVFSPEPLRAAPHSHLATAVLAPPAREAARLAVARAFPDVVTIPVARALEAVNEILGNIARAARAASLLSLVTSALVLAGAIAAGYRQRLREAVIFKMLGAARRQILLAALAEYAGLGLVAAFAGLGVGTAVAWALVAGVMEADFVFPPGPAAATCLLALALTLAFGLAALARALRAPASRVLRDLA